MQRHDHLNLAWSVWNPDRCWEPMRRPYAYRGPFGFDTRRAELPCEAPSIQTRASLLQRVPICRQVRRDSIQEGAGKHTQWAGEELVLPIRSMDV